MSGLMRLHPQHDVVEVARRVGVLDDFLDLVAVARQLARQQLRRAGAEQRLLVDDHHGLGRLARRRVEHVQVGHGDLGALLVAGAEAEGVLQAALDDLVGHADVDHVRQVVLGRGLGGGQADRRGVGAEDRRHAGLVHLLHFGGAGLRRRLRVAQQRLDLRAAQRLDAAGLVDVLDGHQRALAALRAGIRQRPGDRVQHADLHRLGLRARNQREGQRRRGGGRLRHEMATSASHGTLLMKRL